VTTTAVLIFAATYAVMALGRLPRLHIDRVSAAFLGAALMVGTGVLGLDEAYRAIDLDTIALLLGMMIVVANLRLAGFFGLVAGWVVRRAGHPATLLAGVVLTSGLLSSVLVNDTVCLVLTPIVLTAVAHLGRNPVPYLVAIPLASNAGSTATITGNPQNMIIGSLSRLPYGDFAASLAPVAAVALALTWIIVALVWRREFLRPGRIQATPPRVRVNRALLAKTLIVTLAIMAAFFAGVRPALAALVGGAVLLPSRRVKPWRVYAEIDWTLLLMFCGLFVVVAGLRHAILTPDRIAAVRLDSTALLAGTTAVLSNIVSNVPAVLVLRPFVEALPDPGRAWKIVAMAATLAGNFSILGSVANLIVVQRARASGVHIRFGTYFAAGAPLTILSILAGIALL
jgi:Na+/H+ antiporter NhaD/arsenite permease-like protein